MLSRSLDNINISETIKGRWEPLELFLSFPYKFYPEDITSSAEA